MNLTDNIRQGVEQFEYARFSQEEKKLAIKIVPNQYRKLGTVPRVNISPVILGVVLRYYTVNT
jgi:hypothetical protein